MSFFNKLWTDERQDRQETAHLQTTVDPSTTQWTDAATFRVPFDGTVEEVTAWHVPGSESALKTKPVAIKNDDRADLLGYSDGDHFVTGEPDDAAYKTNVGVEQGDEIVVRAQNSNGSNAYRFRYLVTIDYAGGVARFLGGGS